MSSAKPSTDELIQMIRELLVSNFGIDQEKITPEACMRDLGVDSLHVVGILLDLESALGVRLTDLNFPANPTLLDVAKTIESNLGVNA